MFSDLARKLYAEKVVVINLGTLTDVDKDNDVNYASMIVPRNFKLKGVGCSYATASSGGLTAKVTNAAGTVLCSSGATSGTGAVGAQAEDVDVFVSKGDVLLFTLRSTNDTDDYTCAAITVIFEAPKVED